MLDAIGGRYCWLRDVLVPEVDGIGDLDAVRRFGGKFLASIMLEGYANAPTTFSVEIPRVARIQLEMCNDAESQGPKGRGVVVEGPFEEFVGQYLWVEC